MRVEGEKRHLMLSFLSLLHMIYLNLGSLLNSKVSNFERIPTFLSSSWRSNTCSKTSQSQTFIFFKLLNLGMKWDGIRFSRHGHLLTCRICKLLNDPNGSWWCHISFKLRRLMSFSFSKLGNETYNKIHDIINWKVVIA